MSHGDDGFVSFQIRLRDVAFTSSRSSLEEVMSDLEQLGLTPLEINEVFEKTKKTLLTSEVVAAAGQQGVANAVAGLPAKVVSEQGPNCGHGVPTKKQQSKGKWWWTCQAKDAKGTFLWKTKEGCAWVEAA